MGGWGSSSTQGIGGRVRTPAPTAGRLQICRRGRSQTGPPGKENTAGGAHPRVASLAPSGQFTFSPSPTALQHNAKWSRCFRRGAPWAPASSVWPYGQPPSPKGEGFQMASPCLPLLAFSHFPIPSVSLCSTCPLHKGSRSPDRGNRPSPKGRLSGDRKGRPCGGNHTGSVGSAEPGAVVEPQQRQFLHTQGPVARREFRPPLRFCAPEIFYLAKGVTTVMGSGESSPMDLGEAKRSRSPSAASPGDPLVSFPSLGKKLAPQGETL